MKDQSREPVIEDWDEFFLEMAFLVSRKSKDPSTKTGCVVVDSDRRVRSIGYNGFPQGVMDTEERYVNRELKYQMVAHADSNAIFSAARIGVSLKDCTMYLTGPPCSECTKAIIQAGIVSVIWPNNNKFENDTRTKQRWEDSINISEQMALEAGVKFFRWEP